MRLEAELQELSPGDDAPLCGQEVGECESVHDGRVA